MALFQFENVNARQSRQLIERLLRIIHRTATAAVRHREERDRLDQRGRDLEAQNPELADANLYRRAMYVLILPIMIAAYVIDYFLFTPTTEYYAGMVFGNQPQIVSLACTLMPLAIIFVEIYIAIQLTAAREEANEYGATRLGYWGWLGLGLAFASFMPVSIIATHIAANANTSDSNLAAAFGWQAVGLAVLALAAHASILFGGSLAQEAKAFLTFRLSQRSLTRRHRAEVNSFERNREEACTAFSAYMRALANHNTDWPKNRVEPGPFTLVARNFINDQFGYEIIQAPNKASSNGGADDSTPPSGAPPSPDPEPVGPPPPNDNNHDGEREYLRTILSHRVRAEESEVKL